MSQMPPAIDRSEPLLPELLDSIAASSPVGSTISTLAFGKPNRIVAIEPEGVRIETERSLARTGNAELVPAWMLNHAWRRLVQDGTLTNSFLVNDLKVKRSSAVCALLARFPDVEVSATRPITLVRR
jgi:hypothetical protein